MLDLLKAIVTLRLAVVVVGVAAALVLVGVWSLAHGAAGTGIAVLAAVALCVALVGGVAWSHTRQH